MIYGPYRGHASSIGAIGRQRLTADQAGLEEEGDIARRTRLRALHKDVVYHVGRSGNRLPAYSFEALASVIRALNSKSIR